MTDDMPERIAFRKIFMSQAITSGPLMEHPDYIHYVRADRIEALTEQLEAARADAKEAEAYAEELEAKLAKLAKAARPFAQIVIRNGLPRPGEIGRTDVTNIRAALAEIEGEKE